MLPNKKIARRIKQYDRHGKNTRIVGTNPMQIAWQILPAWFITIDRKREDD